MRTKLCWIPFIPITLLMIFLKYMETTLSADETFMGFNIIGIRYAVIVLAPVLLVLCLLISLFDKKTSPLYVVSKNIGAALFSFIAAVAVMFKSVMSIMNILSSGNIAIIDFVTAIVGIIAGIAILFMSSCHLSGKNYAPSLSILMLFPALWAAFELILVFLSYTTISVLSKDMLDLVCYALISLFLFTNAMILGSMEGKNPVKRCFIYGMPTVAVTFAYTTYQIADYINNESFEINDIAITAAIFAIGAYALCEIIELTVKANKKESVIKIESTDGFEEYAQSTVREKVDLLIDDNASDEYEMRESAIGKENIALSDLTKEGNGNTVSQIADEKLNINHIQSEASANKEKTVKQDLDFVIAPDEEKTKSNVSDDLEARMDQIDRLIFEIQSNQQKIDD